MTGNPPNITNININEATKEIYVQWFTDISGLLNIAIIIENTVTGREYRTTVESNEDEAYIAVCNPTDSFNVTVVAFDNCQHFSSDATVVNGIDSATESSTPSKIITAAPTRTTTPTSPALSNSFTPLPSPQCVNNERSNVANEGI